MSLDWNKFVSEPGSGYKTVSDTWTFLDNVETLYGKSPLLEWSNSDVELQPGNPFYVCEYKGTKYEFNTKHYDIKPDPTPTMTEPTPTPTATVTATATPTPTVTITKTDEMPKFLTIDKNGVYMKRTDANEIKPDQKLGAFTIVVNGNTGGSIPLEALKHW